MIIPPTEDRNFRLDDEPGYEACNGYYPGDLCGGCDRCLFIQFYYYYQDWHKPLDPMPEIPEAPHPGAFAAVRTHDIHTGVDLYADEGTPVFAVEPGIVQAVVPFTGPATNTPWWGETQAVIIEGATGVVLYGEITPLVIQRQQVYAGDLIGHVKRVLQVDKGRPMSMLHLELYAPGTVTDGAVWQLGATPPEELRSPTEYLKQAK